MAAASSARDQARGRNAAAPSEIPPRGWWDILLRVYASTGEDRVLLVAGGVTFYLLLALFPALVVFVSAYGLLADPAGVAAHVSVLDMIVPAAGLEMIRDRLASLASQETGALGLGMLVSLLIAFWSANNGVKALLQALNIAYSETEKRSFIHLNLVAFGFTLGAMLVAALLIAVVGIVPAIIALLPLGRGFEIVLSLARWPILFLFFAAGIALLYRYGPSREPAKWRWVSWGSVFATVVWIATSAGFSYYLQNFADYEATYGSLGAVIGFLMWTWISVTILILGARINAETEHQTRIDSTTGEPEPMGSRGAVVADTLGSSSGHE